MIAKASTGLQSSSCEYAEKYEEIASSIEKEQLPLPSFCHCVPAPKVSSNRLMWGNVFS